MQLTHKDLADLVIDIINTGDLPRLMKMHDDLKEELDHHRFFLRASKAKQPDLALFFLEGMFKYENRKSLDTHVLEAVALLNDERITALALSHMTKEWDLGSYFAVKSSNISFMRGIAPHLSPKSVFSALNLAGSYNNMPAVDCLLPLLDEKYRDDPLPLVNALLDNNAEMAMVFYPVFDEDLAVTKINYQTRVPREQPLRLLKIVRENHLLSPLGNKAEAPKRQKVM